MHHHPEKMLSEQTYIKSAKLKNRPTLDKFSLTTLPPKSEQANGSVTWAKLAKEFPFI